MHLRSFILCTAWISCALAQETPPTKPESPPNTEATPAATPAVGPAKLSVVKLDENRFQLGEVVLNKRTREVRFPAKVNMNEGLIEYIVVLPKGKLHEALIETNTSPTHLNLALTLLRYAPSKELFPTVNEQGLPFGLPPLVPEAVKNSARINIEAEWTDKENKTHRVPINGWLKNPNTEAVLNPGPWLYTASDFSEGQYIPEITGDILAIMVDPYAVINYPGSDNPDQAGWHAFTENIPPIGTPISIVITPYIPAPKK